MGKRLTLSEQLTALQQQCVAQAEQLAQLEANLHVKNEQLNTRTAELLELRPKAEKLETVQKELANTNSNKDYYYKLWQDANKELEDLHTVLDVVPGALPRKDPTDQYGKTHGAVLRLTVYFANQGKIKGDHS